jgi:dephospho-CoA kinase
MLKLKKIAITGGVASGKTTVCQFFKELGAYVVNADAIAHELLNPNTDLGQQLLQTFGSLNRKVLAEMVFKDAGKLKKLEELLHPAVLKTIDEHYKKACQGDYSSFVVEFPLLFEIGREAEYDVVIAVLIDETTAKKRFKSQEYDLRMKRQINPKEKTKRATYTIHNDGSFKELQAQVIKINKTIHNQ